MKLEFAILAENADRLEDGKLVIFGGDFNFFQVSKVPAAIPFYLVCKFSEKFGESPSGHKFILEIENPAGERKPMALNGIEIGFGESAHPELPSIAHVFTRLIVQFMAVGLYSLYVMVDGNEMARIPVRVDLQPTAENVPSEPQQ